MSEWTDEGIERVVTAGTCHEIDAMLRAVPTERVRRVVQSTRERFVRERGFAPRWGTP